MNRILFILLLFIACLSACSKSTGLVDQAKINAQGVIDANIINKYLKSIDSPERRVDDTSGVCFLIDTPGTVAALFTNSTQVTVGYTGRQLTASGTLGPVFAQTNLFHPSFVLGSVILGWQLGIPALKKQGGTITLLLPSRYAYGPYPQTDIGLPANAVLVFRITLYNVTN
jgi:FKBP-type peptidyl-prolyl cis-trans isomerase FkpA